MKKIEPKEKMLSIAAGIMLLSILLMLAVIPGILHDTTPQSAPQRAATAIVFAISIHLVILIGYLTSVRRNRNSKRARKGEYMGTGILLVVFGLIYSDGAFAFAGHKDIFYVSILMFASVFCDLTAAAMIISAYFLKR